MTNQRKKKILSTPMEINEIGKLPPQAIDLEEVVLGAMLLEPEAVETCIGILKPESFYKEQNGKVYTAITNLYNTQQPVDILTVTQELRRLGELELVGGAYYVSTLTNRVASSANLEIHARIVQQKHLAREMIRLNVNFIGRAYDHQEDIFELFSEQESAMIDIFGSIRNNEVSAVGRHQKAFIQESRDAAISGKPSGVPTGYRGLDKITGGWQPGELIILAGRPGMGKTAFALHTCFKPIMEHSIPAAFFSLEMPTSQLLGRINASVSEFSTNQTVKKQLNADMVNIMEQDNKWLLTAPLYIDDTPGISLLELRSKLRRLVKKNGVKIAIVDYLQLMTSGMNIQNREQEISTISRGLKALAKELNIPIIALSQLSRAVENRPGHSKKPQLSDLRESGAIEQDADMVIFTYRPSYYEMDIYEYNGVEYPATNLMSLIISKHRNGPLAEVFLGFIPEYAKITNYDIWNKRAEYEPLIQKNLQETKQNSTFVQGTQPDTLSKMPNNEGFLSEKRTSAPDDVPF